MIKQMSSAEGFLKGIKPACLENITRLKTEDQDRLKQYPRHVIKEPFTIFFQTEQMKDEFLIQTADIDIHVPIYHKYIGEVLGYPPKAVQFWMDHLIKSKEDKEKEDFRFRSVGAGLYYCGIQCMGHFEDLIENVYWLWNQYAYADCFTRITVDMAKGNDRWEFFVSYQNNQELFAAINKAQKALEINKQMLELEQLVIAHT